MATAGAGHAVLSGDTGLEPAGLASAQATPRTVVAAAVAGFTSPVAASGMTSWPPRPATLTPTVSGPNWRLRCRPGMAGSLLADESPRAGTARGLLGVGGQTERRTISARPGR